MFNGFNVSEQKSVGLKQTLIQIGGFEFGIDLVFIKKRD